MKILNVKKTDRYLIIETDEGDRKIRLNYKNIEDIERKCFEFKGRECLVEISAINQWNPDVWFSDVWELKSESQERNPTNSHGQSENFSLPLGKVFQTKKSIKIFGPPGTGKTTKLIQYVQDALDNGVQPVDIAFIAFSNQAAQVAKTRVQKSSNLGAVEFPHFCTMHSLATKVGGYLGMTLMREEHFKQFDPKIKCWTELTEVGSSTSIVERFEHPVLDWHSICVARKEPTDFEDYVETLTKSKILSFEDELQLFLKSDQDLPALCDLYLKRFLAFKADNQLANFDDVISKVAKPEFSNKRIPTFELLIIDEAQDLSKNLWDFAEKLNNAAGITYIAGDDDQAIMESLGASPRTFVEFSVTEPDDALEQSYRIPKSVRDYVDAGVMRFIEDEFPYRKPKTWTPQNKTGLTFSGTLIEDKETVTVQANPVTPEDLIREVVIDWFTCKMAREHESIEELEIPRRPVHMSEAHQSDPDNDTFSDWLIMCPTRKTGERISAALAKKNIPHFLRNRPILDANEKEGLIRVQTVHTSKGAEAKNAAVVVETAGDIRTLVTDPRLAYVALTRASSRMFPRVIKNGLLSEVQTWQTFVEFVERYNLMFPLIDNKTKDVD